MDTTQCASPTTSYRGSGTEADRVLSPAAPDDAPLTPNSIRRRTASNPTAASLLPEDEKNEELPQSNDGARTNNRGDFENNSANEGRRATIRGMLCRKSKAFMFGQLLSLLLAATGAVQSALYLDCGLSAPTFSMLSFYLPLCIICITRLFREAKTSSSQEANRQMNGSITDLDLKSTSSDDFHDAGGVVRNHSNEEEIDDSKLHSNRKFDAKKTKPYSLFRIVPLQTAPWRYAGAAVIDVYANYTTLLAFKYTTITSVSLFDALAIPTAMVVSRLFFGRRYTKVHLMAVVVCCIGITLNVLSDYHEEERLKESGGVGETAQQTLMEEEYPYKLAGDALAITGGVLFGVSNTLAEVAVRDWGSQDEFLAAMTFFASAITFVQTMIIEREEVMAFFRQSGENDTCTESGSLTLMFVFVVASIVNYMGIASFLGMSDAAFLNLSLLTGDAWAVAFSVFAEGIIPPPTFYAALAVTVSGVFIYETAPSPVVEDEEYNEKLFQESEIEMDEIGKRSNDTDGCVLT